jgi:hypothetical protein
MDEKTRHIRYVYTYVKQKEAPTTPVVMEERTAMWGREREGETDRQTDRHRQRGQQKEGPTTTGSLCRFDGQKKYSILL